MDRVPRGRQRLAMGAVAAVAALAGVLAGVQVRAGQAEDRRADRAAQQEAAVQEASEAQQRADREAERAAQIRTVLDWATATEQAAPVLEAADAAFAASDGTVDDAVRQVLATAAADLRALLADPPDPPDAADVTALADLTTEVAAATTTVTQAQATWQAEQDALGGAEEEPTEFVARGWPYDGAAPDCGGPGSYEPSQGGAFHTSVPTETGDGTNGNLPRSAMTPLPWCTDSLGNQQWLRTDAAEALIELNEAFRAEFRENLAIDLSYRSYDDQVAIEAALGSLAATPGTSNHGTGTAFDTWEWAAYGFGTPRHEWLVANGPAYGWVCPAATDPANPEYWHFDYVGVPEPT